MVTTERRVSTPADLDRLEYVITELKAIEDEIDDELDAYRLDKPLRSDYTEYSRKRREHLNELIAEAERLMDKYQ